MENLLESSPPKSGFLARELTAETPAASLHRAQGLAARRRQLGDRKSGPAQAPGSGSQKHTCIMTFLILRLAIGP